MIVRFDPERYRRADGCARHDSNSASPPAFRAASLPGPSRRGTVAAHLFAYQLEYGVNSRLGWSGADDAVLCHQCDFAGCTNPAHMRLGTNAVNRTGLARGDDLDSIEKRIRCAEAAAGLPRSGSRRPISARTACPRSRVAARTRVRAAMQFCQKRSTRPLNRGAFLVRLKFSVVLVRWCGRS